LTTPDWNSPWNKRQMCTTDQPLPRVYHVLPTALRAQVTGTLTASIDGETPKGDVQAGMLDFGSNDPYCRSGAPCAPGALNSFFVSTTFDNLVVKGKPVQSVTISIPAPVGVEAIITLDGSNFQYTLPVGRNLRRLCEGGQYGPVAESHEFSACHGNLQCRRGRIHRAVVSNWHTSRCYGHANWHRDNGYSARSGAALGTPTFANTVTTGSTCASQVSFTIPATDLDGDSLTFYVAEVSGNVLYSEVQLRAAPRRSVPTCPLGSIRSSCKSMTGKGATNLYQTLVVTDGTPPQFARTLLM